MVRQLKRTGLPGWAVTEILSRGDMGIDIYGYVEVKKGDAWEYVKEKWPYDGCRNYLAFYFIGHRHSGYGGFPRIAEPRGLPPDLSPKVKAASDEWQGEYFYPSWLTLDELLKYDYNQVVSRQRVITVIENGEPYYLAPHTEEEGEWKDFTLYEELSQFPENFKYLQEEFGNVIPENVRIVFWFDQDWTASQYSAMRAEPMRSDAEVKRLQSQWEKQLLLHHKAFSEDWPNKTEIYQELMWRGQQKTKRWEELLGLSQ